MKGKCGVWKLKICSYKTFPLHYSQKHMECVVRVVVHLRQMEKKNKKKT